MESPFPELEIVRRRGDRTRTCDLQTSTDTLFLPARLGTVIQVRSVCPVTKGTVELRVATDRVEGVVPHDAKDDQGRTRPVRGWLSYSRVRDGWELLATISISSGCRRQIERLARPFCRDLSRPDGGKPLARGPRTSAPVSWLGLSVGTRLMPLAPVCDSACLAAFVLLGRESHGVDGGSGWFFVVVWPFAVGWFASALALRLYTSRSRAPWRLGATAIIGIAVGLLLRVVGTHRDTPIAFIIVAYGFIVLSTFGWRIVPSALSRMARRLT
jgi:hypothetical protein